MNHEIIHKSLHRDQLFMGVDRELCMFSILLPFITAFSGMNVSSLIISVAFWFVSIHYLRIWAKKDPKMRDIYLKYYFYIHKSLVYSAKPSVFSKPPLNIWKKK
jgi:type IV secretory pathway TrbD component